jgi:acetyltransferase-like isoleucine patch superfamily enzyme
MMHRYVVVSYEVVMRLLFALPRYPVFDRAKAGFLRMMGSRIGDRCVFYPGVWISPGRNLVVGDDVDFALDVLITTSGGVEIGDRTLIGYRCQITSSGHHIPAGTDRIFGAGHDDAKVTIGSDVWIGGNSLVLPGVTIGEGAVVAGGSVVTKDVEPFAVVAGVPAAVIRRRN